jgi:hypothetical protein
VHAKLARYVKSWFSGRWAEHEALRKDKWTNYPLLLLQEEAHQASSNVGDWKQPCHDNWQYHICNDRARMSSWAGGLIVLDYTLHFISSQDKYCHGLDSTTNDNSYYMY